MLLHDSRILRKTDRMEQILQFVQRQLALEWQSFNTDEDRLN